jgi:hypothetical protein
MLRAALVGLALIVIAVGSATGYVLHRYNARMAYAAVGSDDPRVVTETSPVPESALRAEASRVPEHVLTWVYYGLVHINEDVPADVMARYADFAEDGDHGEFAAKFKRAGGRYTAAYDDPAYVPYCDPPFKPPAGPCKWEYYRYLDESAWFHDKDGARVHHYVPGDGQYQEAVNPASRAALRAWHDFTAEVHRRAPAIDFIYADDSGGPMLAGDMSPQSSEFYGYNAAGVEITNNDVFRDAEIAYLRQSVLPEIVNGSDPISGLPAYNGAYLRQPFILGAAHEGCFRYEKGLKTNERDLWRDQADSLLSNTVLHRWAICIMYGRPTPLTRVYALASWWITYDPQWSVAAPIDPIPNQSSLLPEFGIVPRFPITTAVARVRGLRTASGAYVREFRGCYQYRVFIGGCAAVVNPTDRTVPLPMLTGTYHRLLTLNDADVMHGGIATWQPGSAPLVPAGSAVVLAR